MVEAKFQVKTDLQRTFQKEGPESIPVTALTPWRLVSEALLNTDAKVKMFKIKRTFGVAQNDASKVTLNASESESETKLSEEEEILEKEIEELKLKLKKCKEQRMSASRPPSKNPFFKDEGAYAPPAYEPYPALD